MRVDRADRTQVFRSFREDQYDFHLYSLRKSVLGAYMAWVHPGKMRAGSHVSQGAIMGRRSPLSPSVHPYCGVECPGRLHFARFVLCSRAWLDMDSAVRRSLDHQGPTSAG